MSLAKNKMALLYSLTNQSKFAQNKKKYTRMAFIDEYNFS